MLVLNDDGLYNCGGKPGVHLQRKPQLFQATVGIVNFVKTNKI
jgi:hypothetical protein